MSKPAQWIDLSGKVAHVTGGARGIGAAIARTLTLAGARVMVSDRNLEGMDVGLLEAGVDTMTLDVTDRIAVDAAMTETVIRLGSLDILVNNAGVYREFGGPVP